MSRGDRIALGLLALFVLAMIGGSWWVISEANKYEKQFQEACQDRGGLVVEQHRDDLCVTPDGHIIPIN